MVAWLETFFKVKENNSTVKREIYAGLLTFLATSYILAVNPAILENAYMDRGGVLCATAIAAFIGTACMAFLANYPLLLAPGMGINAFFAFTIVQTLGFSWQFALFVVVLEGIIFFLLSATNIREKIINAIPVPLKNAMGAGVGLLITLIAFKNANIIKAHPSCLVTIQQFSGPDFSTAGISAILAFLGVIFTAYMMHKKVPGALLIGILATWFLGMICQAFGIYKVVPSAGYHSLFPNFNIEAFFNTFSGLGKVFGGAFQVEYWHCNPTGKSGWALLKSLDFAVICFSLLFADFFDTVGTINGAVANTPLMKKDGTIPRLHGALLADSIATFAGGILGTSTVTTMAESATGVNAGGRTGLAALTGAVLFLLSLIAAPIFMAIPGFATAPALIVVGFLMLRSVKNIDLDDFAGAVPAYMLICGMVFTYSVSDGLGIGLIAWTLLNCTIKGRVNWLLWTLALLFIGKYICL